MHHAYDGFERGRIGRRQDAVSEVEDVARVAAGARENFARSRYGNVDAPEAARGVEVALDCTTTDAAPSLVEVHVPVDADDRTVGRGHEVEQFAGADTEQDRGDTEIGDARQDALGRG